MSGDSWAPWRLKLPAIQLFVQQYLQANDRENIIILLLVFCEGNQKIPLTNGQ